MKEFTLKEWKEKFNEGAFEDGSFETQVDAGWFDWFCEQSSLRNKTKKLGGIVKQLEDSDKIYVWFNNNCPMVGPLYDDFRLADRETGDTLYTTTMDDKRCSTKYCVYGIDNDFEKALLETNERKEVVAFLNEKIRKINGGN